MSGEDYWFDVACSAARAQGALRAVLDARDDTDARKIERIREYVAAWEARDAVIREAELQRIGEES